MIVFVNTYTLCSRDGKTRRRQFLLDTEIFTHENDMFYQIEILFIYIIKYYSISFSINVISIFVPVCFLNRIVVKTIL